MGVGKVSTSVSALSFFFTLIICVSVRVPVHHLSVFLFLDDNK